VQLDLQYVSSCSQFCLPPQDQSRLNVRVQTEGGSSIEAAAPLLAKVEQRLARHPEIEHTIVTLSGGSGQYTLNLVPPSSVRSARKS
jgi:multidrug efflux pump subunit AcrB